VILVSHDRAFLDNVVTQVIAFEGGGRLKEYVGGYDDWVRQRPSAAPAAQAPASPKPAPQVPRPREPKSRLSFKEVKELEALPGRIEALETEQAGLTALLGDAEVYRDDPARVATAQARFRDVEAALAEAYARWESLEARLAAP
jgi:ATP-binding cassette subfamily F protein uup